MNRSALFTGGLIPIPPMARALALVLLAAAAQNVGTFSVGSLSHRMRALRQVRTNVDLRMEERPQGRAPVHVFTLGTDTYNFTLTMTRIPSEKRSALCALWGALYELERMQRNASDGEQTRYPWEAVGAIKQPEGDPLLSGPLGVYINGVQVEGDEQGIAFVRVGNGANADGAIKALFIERVIISPTVPFEHRGFVHTATLQSLFALGQMRNMTVHKTEDFAP